MEPRANMVEYGKRMIEDKLTISSWGNISVRQNENIHITPSGMEYATLRASDIVTVDCEGNVVQGLRKPSSEMEMHLAIYRAREDVQAIVHTHSINATAYAAARKFIPVLTEEIAQIIGGRVEVAEYSTCGTKELAENAVKSLSNKNAVLLANHGVVCVGTSLEEAYRMCIVVEKAAKLGMMTQSLGGAVELDLQEVEQMRANFLANYGQK